ncbi:unnamed protein product [Gongylonema pulchrum]|uniref:G_PROTEIN_RECEP_F2_3 domain-containing protein n=1 Tax=Gongylonema pulchrum TaxID=637853 RepID=A0A183DJL0_9BILA|nr:unnamed protein product [Gongylonema pulchrum]
MEKYLKQCSAQERNDGVQWCTFDFEREFGYDCSKATNYGYDNGNPCFLFVFENVSVW